MKEGDFVEIEYVGKVKLTGEVFDLTSEELAKKQGIHNPKHDYGPSPAIVGSDMVLRGVDNELKKMKVGEEREFDVGPRDGFGMRSRDNIKIVSRSKFEENRINPVPGEYFNIDGRQARVQSVSGGRIRLDFNHPLAGKALSYKVRVLRKVTDPGKKLEKLLDYYKVKYSDVKLSGKKAVVTSEKAVNPMAKKITAEMIRKWVKEVENVEFREKGGKKDRATKAGKGKK